MNTLKIFVLASSAFVALSAFPIAQATQTLPPDQHAAMAQELRQKAAVATEKATAHEAMARKGGSPKAAPGAMRAHCYKLIAQYKTEAAKYSAQAAEHQQQVGSAVLTREQHIALALEFDARAAAANEKVAAHEAMSRGGGNPKASQQAMSNHCEQLIAQYKADAESYAAKASEHRLAAK